MGMGFGATEFCFNASYAKRHPTEYWDKRYSLRRWIRNDFLRVGGWSTMSPVDKSS